MGGIFINYRKGAGRERQMQSLRDELAAYFGEGQVFLDRQSIGLGEDYRTTLTERLLDADVVIAVIHREWADELREREGDQDWVRVELELALRQQREHKNKIIPLLLHGNRMPRAPTLLASIHEISYQQGHKLRENTWDADVRALIRKLELDVASTWAPGEPETVAPTPPRRWVRYPVGAFALTALATPVLALPDDSAAREIAVVASVWSLALMLAPMLALLMTFLFRKQVNSFENGVHDMPIRAYYARVAAPLGALMVLLSGSFIMVDSPPTEVVPFLVAMVFPMTMYLVNKYRKQTKDEAVRTRAWPQRMPEPVRAAPARQELARLEGRIDGWPEHRPTRELCDRADWHLRHLRSVSRALSTDARRVRWQWLVADHPLLLTGYALWIGVSVGFLLAAALPRLVLGVPMIAAIYSAGVAGVTAELAYRRQFWLRTAVVAEINSHATDIARRLTELRERRA